MFGGGSDCSGEVLSTQGPLLDNSAMCGLGPTSVDTHSTSVPNLTPLTRDNMTVFSHMPTVVSSSVNSHEVLQSLAMNKASEAIWLYCSPFIMVLGTLGNVMIVWVLGQSTSSSSSSCSSSMSVYFTALALSDLILLNTSLLKDWLMHVSLLDIRDLHSAICKIHIFLVYVNGMTSAWFLAMMTTQRALSVVWPHKMRQLHSRKTAFITVAITVTLLCLLNVHILYGFELRYDPQYKQYYCTFQGLDYTYFIAYYWPWVDLCMNSLFPFAILLISNTVLMWKVASSIGDVTKLTDAGPRKEVVSQRQKQSTSLNVTLISISAMFFLLTSPVYVYLLVVFNFKFDVIVSDAESIAAFNLSWAVVNILWYSNSAVNFYLYCLTGSRFRTQVSQRLRCVMFNRKTKAESVGQRQR